MPIGIDPESVKHLHYVLFVRPDLEESAAVFVRTIPRQGEVVWVNRRCYEVDRVVRYFITSESENSVHNEHSMAVFLKDPDFESTRYEQPYPDKANRDDSMSTLA